MSFNRRYYIYLVPIKRRLPEGNSRKSIKNARREARQINGRTSLNHKYLFFYFFYIA